MRDRTERRTEKIPAREKILHTAYELFVTHGTKSVGVDTISARSGVAKMTLYHHFKSKEALVMAFLDARAQRWTAEWLKEGVAAAAKSPRDRLLVIFDMFDTWFQSRDFEGCPFLKILSESSPGSPVHREAARQLDEILAFVTALAREARLLRSNDLGQAWMMLMEGAILSAYAGHTDAALKAKKAAVVLLGSWPARNISKSVLSRSARGS